MTFVTWPIAAVAAGIVIPALVILYFLKLRRREVEVSSTLLWKKAIQDLQANAPFQKLRNNILLVLQLLALIVALLAIAQPELRGRGQGATRQIILIDRSASMSASDGSAGEQGKPGRTRLEEAKKQAEKLVDGLRERSLMGEDADEAMVIAFDSKAQILQPFTASKSLLKTAIAGIESTDATSSLEQAYELVKAQVGVKSFDEQVQRDTSTQRGAGFVPQAPPATLHVFSDGRLADAERVKTELTHDAVYHAIGTKDAVNLAITGLRAERSFETPTKVNIFVGLQSTDAKDRPVDVELLIDGVTARIDTTTVSGSSGSGPGSGGDASSGAAVRPGVGGLVFQLDRPAGGIASVRLDPKGADVLETDNRAYVYIPPARRLNVVVVSSGNLWVQSALEGLGPSKLEVITPAEFQKKLDAGQTAQYDVMVFDRVLPQVKPTAGGARAAGLPPGRSLVLGAVPPPPLGAIDQGAGEAGGIVDYVHDHPALRLAGLDKINIGKTRKVLVPENLPVKVIARDNTGPAILEVSDGATQALVVCFDPAETDWPFLAEWVMFMAGSVLHLSEVQSGVVSDGVQAGGVIQSRLPVGSSEASLRTPDGGTVALDIAGDGSIAHGPVKKTGMYTLSWNGQATAQDLTVDGRATRPIAVNLLDPAESDLGTKEELTLARGNPIKPSAETDLTRRLWPWLVLGALAVVLLEWFVYNRKVAI